MEEDVHTEWLLPSEHEVDRTADFMSADGESFSFTVLADQPGVVVLCLLVSSEEKTSRFREGPFEVSVSDLAVFSTELFSWGFSGALDQAAIGDEVLYGGKPVDIVDFIEEDETENFAYSRDTSKTIPDLDIVHFGLFDDIEFEVVGLGGRTKSIQ